MVTRLEMGLALNRIAMLMGEESYNRCKATLDEVEKGVIQLFDKIDELEADSDDGK